MLDVITDFWKPVKKNGGSEKPDIANVRVGSTLTFAAVPQPALSGKTFTITSVNTYQFGDERLHSYVLASDRDDSLSLIVAQAEGEQYLAISRRIPFSDRMKIFDPFELETVIDQQDATRLTARNVEMAWKQWVVPQYKKEIAGLNGTFWRGEANGKDAAQTFHYALLTSENNEYAVEIEKYADGRIEVYATIYRRLSDIASLQNPEGDARPKAQPVLEVVKHDAQEEAGAADEEAEAPEAEAKTQEIPPAAALPPQETAAPTAAAPKPMEAAPKAQAVPPAQDKQAKEAKSPVSTQPTQEKKTMPFINAGQNANGAMQDKDYNKMRGAEAIAAMPKFSNGDENDAIECELRIANKVIEEAIRNEMRLSDVVRRIIALPVANPDSVQIPITLTDSDYQLLAIRYGVSASDRNTIKDRIISELGDFSGKKQ